MRRLFTILAAAALCACGAKHAEATASPPPLLIDGRGVTMPLEQAVTHIAFRPYLPSTQILAFAVLPPLGGLDTNANRGLGIEYLAGANALLLSEWPKQRFAIGFSRAQLALPACTPTHYSTQAVAWTTPGNLVMTLQPDGNVPAAVIDREARRLVRAGACR